MRKIIEQRVQSNLKIFTQEDKKYIKKFATPNGEFDVLQQIRLFQMLPPDIAVHYPALIDYSTNTRPYYYTMPCYDLPTFRELMLYTTIDLATLLHFAQQIFTFLFTIHHRWRRTGAETMYAKKTYIERIQKRLARIARADEKFKAMFLSKKLLVGDEELLGVQPLLEKLEAALDHDKLFGSTLYSTHGQMEFAHILVNIQNTTGKDFILLDAKGYDEMYDQAYDVGKFWMCSAGLFDWIEENQFEITPIATKNGETQVDFLRFYLPERQSACHEFHQIFQNYIVNTYHADNRERAILEYQIAAATHTLGSVDFYYDLAGLTSAAACYIQGVRLLTTATQML